MDNRKTASENDNLVNKDSSEGDRGDQGRQPLRRGGTTPDVTKGMTKVSQLKKNTNVLRRTNWS
jgi:hypothetical protein